MKRFIPIFICLGLLMNSLQTQAQGGCSTLLESIDEAPMTEVAKEYRRLLSYKNPYCDTTGSDFEKLMQKLGKQISNAQVGQSEVLNLMGTPYYKGTLTAYENQKLTIGRDGKPTGKALPPSYKIPTGDYYIVYLWRKKDYLVFACKAGKVADSIWWEKGNYR